MEKKLKELEKEIKSKTDLNKSEEKKRFFKAGPGEYGERDQFLGIATPQLRKWAREYGDLSEESIETLLNSPFNEKRSLALFIILIRYESSDEIGKENVYQFLLKNLRRVNNWNLVDQIADSVIGDYLFDKDRGILEKWARSEDIWERRIAIVSTFNFIKKKDFSDTHKISEILFCDNEDIIHKAVGWMLKEVGKRDYIEAERFLNKHYKKMPRTMLRIAIEKFDENVRKDYLNGKI